MHELILLPGLHGTGELFEPLVRALPGGMRATVVSYPADATLGYAELQSSVDRAVPAAGPYVIVAESFSGPMAIRHAAARPPGLRGLVLCATFAANPYAWPLRRLGLFLARPTIVRVRPPRALLRFLMTGSDCPPELLETIRAVLARVPPAVRARRVREVFDVDVTSELAAIEVPVLCLAASRDRLIGRRAMERVAAGLRDAKTVVLDGPHLLLQTRAEVAAREIAAFVARLDARA